MAIAVQSRCETFITDQPDVFRLVVWRQDDNGVFTINDIFEGDAKFVCQKHMEHMPGMEDFVIQKKRKR